MTDQKIGLTLDASLDPSGVLSAIKTIQNGFNGLKIDPKLMNGLSKEFEKVNTLITKYQSQLAKGVNTKTDAKNLAKTGSEIQSSLNNIVKGIQEVNSTSITLKVEDANQLKTLEDNLKNIKKQIQDTFQQKIDTSGLTDALTKFAGGTGRAKSVQNLVNRAEVALERQELEKFSNLLDEIKGKLNGYKGSTLVSIGKALGLEGLSEKNVTGSIEKITNKINELQKKATEAGESIKGLKEKEEAAAKAVNDFKPDAIARGAKEIDKLSSKAQHIPADFNQIKQAAENAASGILEAKTQVEQLKQSTQYFFSLRNMINLLKRGIREAVDVVKELDAAMTETAVVTDFSVGDMWEKLPQYTANANALGATVKDMYKATTLYYQQGLNTEQSMGIAAETMKMARIGGLEAADATDKMTAALRGFNMELNEVSAKRVNDVYSNLAAKTASDTKELGTAMQRTASIAASAGMSFEGTAAFLAQAIETTREPAENLGTAMKTIVARFTELKKNPLEIAEVDGEEVSYNKVDTALQSIGVSLKDANGQFRELDQVFLDIAKRWDSLTQTQQRYVATTAAGSRQQSRFIAMMSNYERTVQLMDYANNSAGASNEQFGKTMESLEAKLNKLRNAWNEFLMGIMDSSWIKGLTDGMTTVLDKTNSLINLLSGGGKLKGVKSFLSLFTAFTGLRLAGKGVNALIGGLGKFIDPTSKRGFLGIGGGTGAQGIAGKITLPIVAKLNELIGVVKGQKTLDKTITSTLAQYKNAANLLRMPQTVGTMRSALGQLSNEHAYAAYRNSPGTASAMQRTATDWLNAQLLDSGTQKTGEQLMNSIFKGMQKNQIPIKKGAELIGKPQLWGKYLGTETARQFSENYVKTQKVLQAQQIKNAQQQAADMAWKAFGGSAFATDEDKKSLYAKNKDLRDLYKNYYKQIRQGQKESLSLDTKNINVKPYEQLANRVGILSSNFTAAGYSMQMFGAQLGQLSPGLAGVGNLISRLGVFASTSGMAIAGLGKTYTQIIGRITQGVEAARLVKYGDTIGALINSGQIAKNGMLAQAGAKAAAASGAQVGGGFVSGFTKGIPAPLIAAAIITTIVGVMTAVKHHVEKKAQEAGEKVRKDFEEGFTKKEEKIQSLENYKDSFNELAKGVDQFGHNISLSSEEYDEYLNISRELKDLSPSLIAGYNAEGEAIIKKGDAIQEVINKLKEEKQAELDLFTSDTSINKLIGEYQTSDAYTNNHQRGNVGYYSGTTSTLSAFNKEIDKIASLDNNNLNFKLLDSINQLTGWNLTSFSTITADQLNWLSKHYNDVINLIEEKNGQLDDKVKEGYVDAFTNAGVAIKEVMTEGQPIIDAMQMWMSAEGIDAIGLGIGEEFGDSFNQGVEGILLTGLSKGWTADEFKSSLTDYAKGWKDLAGSTSEYNKIMEEAQDIQDEYLDTIGTDGAIDTYNNNITSACDKLIDLANNTDTATEAGKAFQQQCIAQANALRNFTEEGGINLAEALNTAVDDITAAEGALDSFTEATKRDYSTAAEGMRSIFDKVTETFKDSYGTEIQKHAEGMGDATFWTGAEALLSGKELERLTKGKNGYEAAEAVAKKIKGLEPMLREGQEGFDAFSDRVLECREELDKLDGVTYNENGLLTNIPEDKWHEVAEALGISDDLLTSMLNKGRQFADISFMNVDEAKQALAASDYSITGTQAAPGKQQNVYVKEDTLRAELVNTGYVRKEQQDEQIAKLLNEGVKTIPADATQLSKDELDSMAKDWGVSTLPDLIQTLNDTGDFTKDEIKNYADQMGLLGSDAQYDTLYSDIIAAAENPELVKQTGVLETISAQIAAMAVTDNAAKGETQKELDKANEKMLGGKGVDTDAQAFAYGKKLVRDENGNIVRDQNGNAKLERLTAGEYEETKKSMQAIADSYRETAAIAAAKAKSATGEDKKYWEGVQKDAEEGVARADKYIQMAHKAMKEQEETDQKEAEGRQKEIDARKKAREEEQKQRDAEAKKRQQEEKEAKDYLNKDRTEPRKLTDADANKARQEGREAERKAKEEEGRKKELEARNKAREEQQKQEEALTKKENEGRQQEISARNKAREEQQKQEQALRQKEAQGRQQEIDARNKARQEEQARIAAEQQEKRGEQKENYWRERGKQENQVAQVEDIQSKTDHLLQTSINTSLKTALDNLDPTQIASDPAQSQAFANLYKDLINGTLPKAEDLQTLGIFGKLDSQYQDQITGAIEEKASTLGEKISAAYEAFANADKAALAMDVVPTNDNISKAITTVGKRLKNWWDKINNVNAEANQEPKVAPAVNTGAQAVANIAKEVKPESQAKITVDTSESEAKITNLKTLIDNTVSTIQKGATFNVNVNDSGLANAAKRAESITKASGDKSINVTASGADGANKLSSAVKDFSKLNNKTVTLTAKTSGLSGVQSLTSAVQAFHRLTDKTITLKTVKETVNKQATGARNHNYFPAPSIAGSAARGSYGQVGPKGKGGLTLTGELGYEVAWIPSENRSMILGANGPQMVDLPGDAVVWTHEQSKKILKQKSIPAGSQSAGETASTYQRKYPSTTTATSTSVSNTGKTVAKTVKDTADKVKKDTTSATDAVRRVSVWWENIARLTEASQRRMDNNQKAFEKYIKDMRATLTKTGESLASGGGGGDDYIKAIGETMGYYQAQLGKATEELNQIVSGTWQSGPKAGQKATSKKTKKKKTNQAAYEQGADNIVQISYEGKTKKGKKTTKTAYVDTSKYIKEQNGTYTIDQAALDKVKNKKERQALADALNKEINDRIAKRNQAEDEIRKAQEALEKFGEELYETFFAWEIELTRIWNITQKIEQAQAKIGRTDAMSDLHSAQLESGMIRGGKDSAQTTIQLFKQRLEKQNEILIDRQAAIDQTKQDITTALTSSDDQDILKKVKEKLASNTLSDTDRKAYEKYQEELEKDIDVVTQARKYTNIIRNADGTVSIDFNTEDFEKARLNGDLTGDMAKAIQDWVKEIQELSKNLDDGVESLTKEVAEYYSLLKDLQQQWAEYESQLIQITEEAGKKQVDQFKKLSDSINKSLDRLLSEVKRRLDERRKQEDNAKTEQDISQKQQRLAALRADTSGGHQVEIAQLEKEIADAQQNYERSLEDQLLEKLQNQADEASQQRERQIELQEALLTSVNNIALVEVWMSNPEKFRDQIWEAFKVAKGYDNVGSAGKAVIEKEFQPFMDGLAANQQQQKDLITKIEENTVAQNRLADEQHLSNINTSNISHETYNPLQAHEQFGFDYKDLREISKYSAEEFKKSGVSVTDALNAGFEVAQLKEGGYTADEFKSANLSANVAAQGYTGEELRAGGYTASDLKKSGVALSKAKEGFKETELKAGGYTATDFVTNGYTAGQLINAGLFSAKDFSARTLSQGNVSYSTARTAYTDQQLNGLYTQATENVNKYWFELEKRKKAKSISAAQITNLIQLGRNIGRYADQTLIDIIGKDSYTGLDPFSWDNLLLKILDVPGISRYNLVKTFPNNSYLAAAIKKHLKKNPNTVAEIKAHANYAKAGTLHYKTGGLADFTGPAWLDGTPSKPELVLNAKDTANFIALKDVLSRAMNSTKAINNSYGGDNVFEININVDKITSDYDVDKMADRIKKIIVKDSSYRNVTQVRNFR